MKTMLMEVNLSVCPQRVHYEYPQKINMDKMFQTICDYYNLSPEVTKQKSRKREFVMARQIFMYLLSTYTNTLLRIIGEFFPWSKDHTTVIHGRETIKDLIFSDPEIKRQVEYLKIQCGL